MELLDTAKTAEILTVHPQTLATWRMIGEGPPFVRVGRKNIRYRASDVERWIEDNLRSSTSEAR